MVRLADFAARGWARFGVDAALLRWVEAARAPALDAANDPAQQADWLRCGGTWFVGVNALPNKNDGAVDGVPLAGGAVDFVKSRLGMPFNWDRAQVSICYPGYPRQSEQDSAAAFRYRLNRDAAHLDGLHRVGPRARRMLRERHGFLLGIALTDASATAAPLVVWEGSHKIMQAMLARALGGVTSADWAETDVTDAYQAARQEVFATCRRIPLPIRPGEATILHRHALHGVAPWENGATAAPEGRAIAYFRPEVPLAPETWLAL